MSVYVDSPLFAFGGRKMCHMIADTEAELYQMADKLKLNRAWVQHNKILHFDLSVHKREQAIRLGALPVDHAVLVRVMRRLKGGKDGSQG